MLLNAHQSLVNGSHVLPKHLINKCYHSCAKTTKELFFLQKLPEEQKMRTILASVLKYC